MNHPARSWRIVGSVLLFMLGLSGPGRADAPPKATVGFASVFTDHMVIQRDVAAPVWGWATPGASVSVSVSAAVDGRDALGATRETKADGEGRWMVKLPTLKAGGPFEISAKSGETRLVLSDVLAGDVWVCSGQSNMEWPLSKTTTAKEALEGAKIGQLRLFTVKRTRSVTPLSAANGEWAVSDEKVAAGFSGVGFYFGREIQKDQQVPIGLINTSWGGTTIECWMSPAVLSGNPVMAAAMERNAAADAAYQAELAKYQEELKLAKATGKPDPQAPKTPGPGVGQLYNGMIAPLVPMAIKGVIWYQGEANANNAAGYHKSFPQMIANWRADFAQGDFPFLFVQLANWDGVPNKTTGELLQWAYLREAQTATLSVPKTAMAVTIDIGDGANIHPQNKIEVGRRLALGAKKIAYGRDVVYSGPMFKAVSIADGKATVSFDHVGGGLVARGGALQGFAVAGADQVFVPALATIEGDKVVVRADGVKEPVAVRYGWANNPTCNLYNKDELPAVPFRTDEWAQKPVIVPTTAPAN